MSTRTIFHCLLVIVTFQFAITVTTADERHDATRLRELVTEVRKILPAGWEVETSLGESGNPSRRGPVPVLVIATTEPINVTHVYPSGPADEVPEASEIVAEIVKLQFEVVPFMSKMSFATHSTNNAAQWKRRRKFHDEELTVTACAFKGRNTKPPWAFDPQNDHEKELVMRYAFLWQATQSKPMPTHHIDRLSFRLQPPHYTSIQDKEERKEYQHILTEVQKIIVPYEATE